MNIIEAINNEKLFKPHFKDLSTWQTWLVVLKAIFGLKMDRKELALFKKLFGKRKRPTKPVREFWMVKGRRAGFSSIVAVIAVYLALFYDFKRYLSAGEHGVIQIVAADRKQARVIFDYILGILYGIPVFEQYVQNQTKELIELTTGINIEVATCSFRTIRGRTVVAFIGDEIAFWRVEGANPDREILAAVRPSMATIPNSFLFVGSSPYGRFGVLYETHRDYFGIDNNEILVCQAPTRQMNPTIDEGFIEKELVKDPEAGESEYMAYFRKDLETFLRLELIQEAIVTRRYELPPADFTYRAFVDPSGGQQDCFTLSIGHREKDILVQDVLRSVKPPFKPNDVVRDYCELLRSYNIREVTGDRYAGAWVSQSFEDNGIRYIQSDLTKSDIYLNFEPLLAQGRVELLDNRLLFNELRMLERRTGRGGKDSVDHPLRGSDDSANSSAGVVVNLDTTDSFFSGCDLT